MKFIIKFGITPVLFTAIILIGIGIIIGHEIGYKEILMECRSR